MISNISDLKRAKDEVKNAGLDDLVIKLDHVAYRVKMGQREKAMKEIAKKVRNVVLRVEFSR